MSECYQCDLCGYSGLVEMFDTDIIEIKALEIREALFMSYHVYCPECAYHVGVSNDELRHKTKGEANGNC